MADERPPDGGEAPMLPPPDKKRKKPTAGPSRRDTRKRQELWLERFEAHCLKYGTPTRTLICDDVALPRRTFYNWMERYKKFAEKVHKIEDMGYQTFRDVAGCQAHRTILALLAANDRITAIRVLDEFGWTGKPPVPKNGRHPTGLPDPESDAPKTWAEYAETVFGARRKQIEEEKAEETKGEK